MRWVAALNLEGQVIWIVDAHGYGKRFIVRSNEILTAFAELERGDSRVRGEFDVVNHFCRCGGESDKTESAA